MFHATVIGKLMYCAPVWHCFCDYVHVNYVPILHRCVKLGYAGQSATVILTCSWKPMTRCFVKYNIKPKMFVYLCLFLCSLCTPTVLSGSGSNFAYGIVIPSGWLWELASAARARRLALRAPGKFGTSGWQAQRIERRRREVERCRCENAALVLLYS